VRELGVCRSAPLGLEVGCSVASVGACDGGATLAGSLDGGVVGASVGRREIVGIEVVGPCDGDIVGFFVRPTVGIRVVGTCDGVFVGFIVGLVVGVEVIGRCVTGADGAPVGSSVGAGLGLGVVTVARGTGFSRQVKNCKRRPGFRDKYIVVVSSIVSTAGTEEVVKLEGQTDGTSCSHVQSVGPSTLLVMGSSRKSGVTSTGSLIPERKIATASVSLVAAPVFKESR
jgi:hypothetical protein